MTTLQWSDALASGLPEMDQTHHEFVDLLAAVDAAGDSSLVSTWRALVDHTDSHFGREDAWMRSTRFSSANCHSVQHQVVLAVMREGLASGLAGDLAAIRRMSRELALWFVQHAQTMDAALALHLRSVGYDAGTGVVSMPAVLPKALIEGCGGAGCASRPAARVPALAAG